MNAQFDTTKRFGEIAVELGFLTVGDVDTLLKSQIARRSYLGEILVEMGRISREKLEHALNEFQKLNGESS